jgi:hypothetical protein
MVMGSGKLQAPPGVQELMKSSSATSPFTTGWPFWMLSVSPGPATMRLMKLTSDFSGVGSSQAAPLEPPAPVLGSPH